MHATLEFGLVALVGTRVHAQASEELPLLAHQPQKLRRGAGEPRVLLDPLIDAALRVLGSRRAARPRSIRSLIAACSSEMGGGAGPRRARSSSSTASIRRLSSRSVCPCLPPGDMGPPLGLLHHSPQSRPGAPQARRPRVSGARPRAHEAGISYLVGDGGGRPLHPTLKHPGVEVFKEPLDLPYLRVVTGTSCHRGVSLRSSALSGSCW